jgi:Family of unknown function (DUF5906)
MKLSDTNRCAIAEDWNGLKLIDGNTGLEASKKKPRKTKVSRVPEDYYPFDQLEQATPGFGQPEQICWIDESIARPIDISELSPLWRKEAGSMGTSDRRHRFLASIVASVGGEYYVRRKDTGIWTCKKKVAEVKNILWNEWGEDQTKFGLRPESIESFFAEDNYVVLDQLAYIPGAGSYVEFSGRKCLNTYYERPLKFRTGASNSTETQLLMELIVRNLLNHQDGDVDAWLGEIVSGGSTAIRWLFHWLASQYQRPGKALPTTLWFVGPSQGVGKGLFTSGLSRAVGRSNVKVVSAEEFKSDWTDFLTSASLYVLDEVDFSSRKEANAKLKRLVGNDTVAARKRNIGEFEVPAVANFLFTTNNIRPLALDRDDRRNTFFETCGTHEAKQRATAFYELGPVRQRLAWEGLVEVLSLIDIDDRLISRALETDIKRRMIDSGQEPFYEWFQSDATVGIWKHNEFAPSSWIKDTYLSWARENAFAGCATSAYCQGKLDELVSEGFLSKKTRKTLQNGTKPWGYVRVDPLVTETAEDDCDVILPFRASDMLRAMREAGGTKGGPTLRSIHGGAG